MDFLSFGFLAALLVAAGLYHRVAPRRRALLLVAASYLFYATWSVPYAALLLSVTALVYGAALRLAAAPSEAHKRRVLALALALVLGLLSFFKLSDAACGILPQWSSAHLLIPIGISYYVFKLASYVVDVYWERAEPERDFAAFAAYVAFFPQILSGPIQRAGSFLPQLRAAGVVPTDLVLRGCRLMLFGFFKKLVVADRLREIVDPVFADPRAATGAALLAAGYLYAVELYADLSGFTDIAIGAGRLFGIDAPQNFDRPFYAPNVQQFWRRWHMTLTSWLTDYLFTPLRLRLRGAGQVGLAIAILVNMIAIGAWHGLKTTYLAFGALNGVYVIVSAFTLKPRDRFWRRHPALARARALGAPLVTFQLVVIGFVLARARSLSDGLYMLGHAAAAILHPRALGGLAGAGLGGGRATVFLWIALMEVAQLNRSWLASRPTAVRFCLYYAAIAIIFFFGVPRAHGFIYTQF